MTFRRLAEYLQRLEETPLRNKMTQILSELFGEPKNREIGKICYLLLGRLAPLYQTIEFGLGERMIIRAIADGLYKEAATVTKKFKKSGDLGITVEQIKNISGFNKGKALSLNDVYEALMTIAIASGTGSQEQKIKKLGELIQEVDSLSARYIVRIPIGKLRLGFSDMTILDSLSFLINGTKKHRPVIERAYNLRADIGFIASVVKGEGIEKLEGIQPQVGTPILMARAERMSSSKEIIDKIGKGAIEAKYDGFRIQAHLKRNKKKGSNEFIKLYSRNLEDVTLMYPDIVEGLKQQIKADEAIIEGEAVAYNPNTGEYLPFQETVQRKRKYDIEAKAKEIPLKLFVFELLFKNRKSYINDWYEIRKKELKKTVGRGETILFAPEEVTDNPKRLEEIFQDAVSRGLEGVMAKKLDGVYRAGARDFSWIKFKRSYAGKLTDTIDAVVMGYDFGQGKRAGFGIGDFLIGVYDNQSDMFLTIAKIGTGLTDEEWRAIKVRSDKLKVNGKPLNYEVDKIMDCDIWIAPEIVVEIRADEITRSPVHTAGRIMGPSKSGSAIEVKEAGLALRFPRLEKFRDDKTPTDATTLKELKEMLKKQKKL